MSIVYVVGLGPGAGEQMTAQARQALEQCSVIAGYTVYIDLIREEFPEKQFLMTPMRKEAERCKMALEQAQQGQDVAMVCSGDAGVYGMAGPILELSPEYPQVEIEVVPGITAALSGGAVLGAPLTHDFAIISLSDLLTPWETIEKRLHCAAEANFVLCIYNPRSKKRADHLMKACDIVMEHRDENTVCGIVRNIGREGQEHKLMTLRQLRDEPVDMFTTVFIGNSATRALGDKMVTPRGYENKKR